MSQIGEQQEHYKKTLEFFLASARDEYKQCTIDWRNRQTGLNKTYLWIAITLIAAELHIFSPVWNNKQSPFLLWHIEPSFWFYLFAALALLASFVVFMLGIDTLRGRDEIMRQFQENYSDLAIKCYNEVFENAPIKLYSDMLNMIDTAIYMQRIQIKHIAYKLRAMSYLLILSVVFSFLAVVP